MPIKPTHTPTPDLNVKITLYCVVSPFIASSNYQAVKLFYVMLATVKLQVCRASAMAGMSGPRFT